MYTEDGISSSKMAIEELRLSQKRFYSRLKDLIDVGLIEKKEGAYRHTAVGKLFLKIGHSLLEVLDNKEQIELLERLRETSKTSDSKLNKISSAVSESLGEMSGLFRTIFFTDLQSKVETLDTYEKLVEKLVEEIESCNDKILFASRYLDNKVIDSMFKVSKKGINSKVIMARDNLEDKMNKLQLLLSPGLVLAMLDYFSDPNLDELMRDGEVPFSLCIIDGEHCFFELPSLGNHDFTIAFYVMDGKIGSRFTKIFLSLWEASEARSLLKFFQMLKNTEQKEQS
jgi:predicted transcriptional regulator